MNPKLNPPSFLSLITDPVRSCNARLAVQWALTLPTQRIYLAAANQAILMAAGIPLNFKGEK